MKAPKTSDSNRFSFEKMPSRTCRAHKKMPSQARAWQNLAKSEARASETPILSHLGLRICAFTSAKGTSFDLAASVSCKVPFWFLQIPYNLYTVYYVFISLSLHVIDLSKDPEDLQQHSKGYAAGSECTSHHLRATRRDTAAFAARHASAVPSWDGGASSWAIFSSEVRSLKLLAPIIPYHVMTCHIILYHITTQYVYIRDIISYSNVISKPLGPLRRPKGGPNVAQAPGSYQTPRARAPCRTPSPSTPVPSPAPTRFASPSASPWPRKSPRNTWQMGFMKLLRGL